MADFNILNHWERLEPDGGTNDPEGDHSFKCPSCGANNFKVHIITGKWNGFGCKCCATEEGKRRIRDALSPACNPSAKPTRPKQKRSWNYYTLKTLDSGRPALAVHRTDPGDGTKKRIWQESLVSGYQPTEIAKKVLPFGYAEAKNALEESPDALVFWVEGEPCVDALRQLGLVAVTSLGGCRQFNPERDGNHFPPNRLVVVPDRDRPGLQYMEEVEEAYPGCRWLYPFPDTPQWNGQCPPKGGLDIADWIDGGATVEDITAGIGLKSHRANSFDRVEVAADQPPAEGTPALPTIDEWDQTLASLVNPSHPLYERNTVRRQIRAATVAKDLDLCASPQQVRARLIQKQRELIAGTAEKGIAGGTRATFSEKKWLIRSLIAEGCLTGVAAFAKVGKTKFAAALAASLIHQQPFMGNPDWLPAPGHHKLILWWTDQPCVDSAAYLQAVGLMEQDGTLHHQIVRLYTEEDDLCWDDQGVDELVRITAANPGAILITDSFYANVQRQYGSDQEPDAGGALIDVQTLLGQGGHTHVCCFHSSKETGNTGVQAIRGHSSAAGVPSAVISLHFLERKCPSGSGKWVADKENPHRRMVTEGRLPYSDLLVRLDGASGQWQVIGQFHQALAELQSDDRKSETIDSLTIGQRETLEWVGGAIGAWKSPQGVTAHQVAGCKVQHLNRQPTASEVENTRKQLRALVKAGLLSESRQANVTRWSYRTENG